MRRGGELIGVRDPGSLEYRYPSWQFGEGWRVKPIVAVMVAAARERGIRDDRLGEILEMRVGMGGRRVEDLARAGTRRPCSARSARRRSRGHARRSFCGQKRSSSHPCTSGTRCSMSVRWPSSG